MQFFVKFNSLVPIESVAETYGAVFESSFFAHFKD